MNTLYPLKFYPIIKDKIWGGKKLRDILNKPTMSDKAGESWEISAVPENVSVVANGFLEGNDLTDLIEVYMGDLVGDKIFDKYGTYFPLLIKYIDAADKLSIQVHPDDELALKRHNSYGKTEMWYVLEAESGSTITVGFNKDVDKATYLKHLKNNSLEEILNIENVEKGDVFFLPAGRIHAIGKGILLAEIQQTSDITYRIYDYNRLDENGNPRELHTEEAIDAIDYKAYKEYKTKYVKKENESTELVKCNYFTVNLLNFNKLIQKDYINLDSFVIYMCIEGSFILGYYDNEKLEVKKGETILIPAVIKNLFLQPLIPSEILEIYIE